MLGYPVDEELGPKAVALVRQFAENVGDCPLAPAVVDYCTWFLVGAGFVVL